MVRASKCILWETVFVRLALQTRRPHHLFSDHGESYPFSRSPASAGGRALALFAACKSSDHKTVCVEGDRKKDGGHAWGFCYLRLFFPTELSARVS
jgi:hypothetical protein